MKNLLDKQIQAIKEINKKLKKAGYKISPIIIGKFALSVYTQGMYPSNMVQLLFPDLITLDKVLRELGYEKLGDFYTKEDIVVQISKNFEIIPTGEFNQFEVDGDIINVISLEDLLVDMMKECVEGDTTVCDLIKMLIRSYARAIDFHKIFQKVKDKRALIKFREFQKLVQ